MRLAYVMARQCLPKYTSKFSRKDFTLPQLFACLVVKDQMKLSYRRAETLLGDCPEWCAQIGLRSVPDHNTLQRAAKFLLRPLHVNGVLDLIAQWAAQARLLRLSSHPVAVDSTTFESHHVSRHYEKRCHETRKRMKAEDAANGRSRTRSQTVRRLPKLAIGVDTGSHLILSFWTGTGAGSDHPHFKQVVGDARRRVRCRRLKVVADAGYDSEANHLWARYGIGVRSFIPAKHGRPRKDGGPPNGQWRRRMACRLGSSESRKRCGYTKRWQIETVNSMIKRNQSSALSGKTAWSRKRDMMLKVLTHDLMILGRRGSRQSSNVPLSVLG
jgi:hypothetical protein